MKKYRQDFAVAALIIFIFPVLITFAVGKINVNKKEVQVSSGKIIEADYGNYIAEMDMEDFISCVLMAQMPIDSPKELLKAQTVVIRTYILGKMGDSKKISSNELGLPFVGYESLAERWFIDYRIEHSRSAGGIFGNLTGIGKSRIFEQNIEYLHMIQSRTQNKVLKYKGNLIIPLFHEISAGSTRDGDELAGKQYEYLKSVKCSTDSEKKDFIGIKYFTIEQFKKKLADNDIVIYKEGRELFSQGEIDLTDFVKMIDCSQKDKKGYVVFVKIADTKIPAEKFADSFGLASTYMSMQAYEKGIRITTRGKGHGFGMSLSYAGYLAQNGMEWQDILKKFYDAVISDC